MRILPLAAVGAVAATTLLMAAPAHAATETKIKLSASSVYQGGSFYVAMHCSHSDTYATLSTSLLSTVPTFGVTISQKVAVTKVNVSATQTPGPAYTLTLNCRSESSGNTVSHASAKIAVLQRTSTSPSPATTSPSYTSFVSSYGHSGTPDLVVNTGLGGMASRVAAHHPAS